MPYFPASWLKVSGEDSAAYLQGQMARDLAKVGPDGHYTVILDHKGKIQADAFVGRDGEGFWVGSYFVPAAELRARLEAFVVADDVVVDDATETVAGFSVLGNGSRPELDEARSALGLPGAVFRGRRIADENWDWIVLRDRRDDALQWFLERGARVLGVEEVQRRRILGGIPAVPDDAGKGDLPQETRLSDAAVSYDKGCYVGQEIMSRLKTRGRVRRQLRRIHGTGEPPPAHTAVLSAETKVGETRSAVRDGSGFIGWALITGDGADLSLGGEVRREIALTGE
ncbi:MAG TPA: hypothetical protein VGL42_09150 [Opitutaceae bacterium]